MVPLAYLPTCLPGWVVPTWAPACRRSPPMFIPALSGPPANPQAALDKLPGELKAQQANAAAVERRLQREKGVWVPEGPWAAALPRDFVQVGPSPC